MTLKVKHRVHFYETDTMSVVHHANYIRWFEIGRVEYLRAIGIDLNDMMADNIVFPITKVEAKFHSSAHFDEELEIETEATALTKAKMEFEYRVIRSSDNKLLVTGYTQNVFTDKTTGKIMRVPEKYYSLMCKAQS